MSEAKSAAAKLRVLSGAAVWVSDPSRAALLGDFPAGSTLADAPSEATVAVVFADDAAAVRRAMGEHGSALAGVPAFWVAYPKANRTDINRDRLWPILAEFGFRPISQVAIDEVWSALRFRPMRECETLLGAED